MPTMASQINQTTKSPNSLLSPHLTQEMRQNNSNTAVTVASSANQNPFNNSGNPFGDNFSNLNDNDIFGLEFDRIRQSNDKSSNNNLDNQGKLRLFELKG